MKKLRYQLVVKKEGKKELLKTFSNRSQCRAWLKAFDSLPCDIIDTKYDRVLYSIS